MTKRGRRKPRPPKRIRDALKAQAAQANANALVAEQSTPETGRLSAGEPETRLIKVEEQNAPPAIENDPHTREMINRDNRTNQAPREYDEIVPRQTTSEERNALSWEKAVSQPVTRQISPELGEPITGPLKRSGSTVLESSDNKPPQSSDDKSVTRLSKRARHMVAGVETSAGHKKQR